MKELLFIVDYTIYFLLIVFLILLLTIILPSFYGVFFRLNVDQNKDYNRFGYMFNGQFWAWLFSKEGLASLYRDSKQRKIVYDNNFRYLRIIWKLLLVLLTFRVLVNLFGPNQLFEQGMKAL